MLLCLQLYHLINVSMSKFKPNMAGQSVVDRVLAAKHTVAGQSLAKVICKATTEEVMGPKRKHLDCKFCRCFVESDVLILTDKVIAFEG